MEPIVLSIEIDRPPADVYAYATDPPRFPEWQKDVAAVEIVSGVAGAKGSRFKTIRQIGPAKQAITQEVTEADAPRRWSARGIKGPIRATGALTIEPLDDGRRSRVKFEIVFDTGTLGKLILPIIRRQTESLAPKSFALLKQILEGANPRPTRPPDRGRTPQPAVTGAGAATCTC